MDVLSSENLTAGTCSCAGVSVKKSITVGLQLNEMYLKAMPAIWKSRRANVQLEQTFQEQRCDLHDSTQGR